MYDQLIQEFGRENVFKDVDSIPPGVDFRAYLDAQVAQCDVFLAVIGPDWMRTKSREGKSWLEDPDDFVRIGIESALKRNILVVPVLVRGASIPAAHSLPESIRDLSYRHGLVVRTDPDFDRDMARLIASLKDIIPGLAGESAERVTVAESAATESLHTTETARLREAEGMPRSTTTPGAEGYGSHGVTTQGTKVSKGSAVEPRVEGYPFVARALRIAVTGGWVGLLVLGLLVVLTLAQRGLAELSPSQELESESALCRGVPGLGPEMMVVESGIFNMGSENSVVAEGPVHAVQISKFAIGTCEVTFEDYDRFAQHTGRALPNDSGWGRGPRPVINVTWEDAKAYAKWLSQQTGKGYRLPTEAEWEYAAWGGERNGMWAGASNLEQLANYAVHSVNSQDSTASVGGKRANGFGLYDMIGNVAEWVEDCWHENYTGAPRDGSAWLESGDGDCRQRVLRGGSWYNLPVNLRASTRGRYHADLRGDNVGFRLVQDVQ
jgi:formylglycine-generating enzyme required for sulfatase activity